MPRKRQKLTDGDGKFKKGERRSPATEFKKGVAANPATVFKPGHKLNPARPEGYIGKDNYGYRMKQGDKWVRMMHPDPLMNELMKLSFKLRSLLRAKHRELTRRNVQAAREAGRSKFDHRTAKSGNQKSARSVKGG